MIAQKMLSQMPTLTIWACLIRPVPKTSAFGGVATGSINAQLAPMPMMSARPSGGAPSDSAIEMKSGTKSAAEAVFEVNSVKKTMKNATTSPIKKMCPP